MSFQNMTSIVPCPTVLGMSSSVSLLPLPCPLIHPFPFLRPLQHPTIWVVLEPSSSTPHSIPLLHIQGLDPHHPQILTMAASSAPDKAYPPSALVPPYRPAQPLQSSRSLLDMIPASPWPRQQSLPVEKRNAPRLPSNSSTLQQSTVTTLLLHVHPLLLQSHATQPVGSPSGGRNLLLPRHDPSSPAHITYPIPRRWWTSIIREPQSQSQAG